MENKVESLPPPLSSRAVEDLVSTLGGNCRINILWMQSGTIVELDQETLEVHLTDLLKCLARMRSPSLGSPLKKTGQAHSGRSSSNWQKPSVKSSNHENRYQRRKLPVGR